jgi:hypothetical protein
MLGHTCGFILGLGPDTKEPQLSIVHLKIHCLWPTHQCPHQNLLVMPTLSPIACLTGRKYEWNQLQPCSSSFELWTFLGHCVNILCFHLFRHAPPVLMCYALDLGPELSYTPNPDLEMYHVSNLEMYYAPN